MLSEHTPGAHPWALFTDLYECFMVQAYYAENMTSPAVFELYFRELPASRNYIMTAGLESADQLRVTGPG